MTKRWQQQHQFVVWKIILSFRITPWTSASPRPDANLGREAVILGHHYQRDEVIRFADFRGDSYKLSQEAARAGGKYIVFCGVHFMAESADVLSRPGKSRSCPI